MWSAFATVVVVMVVCAATIGTWLWIRRCDVRGGFMLSQGTRLPLRWRQQELPLTVYILPRADFALRAACHRAVLAFNRQTGLALFESLPQAVPDMPVGPSVVVEIARVDENGLIRGGDGRPLVARTDLNWDPDTGYILSATIVLPDASGDYHELLLHEFGHALGLDHSLEDGSVMYPWLVCRREPGRLSWRDCAHLRRQYGRKSRREKMGAFQFRNQYKAACRFCGREFMAKRRDRQVCYEDLCCKRRDAENARLRQKRKKEKAREEEGTATDA